MMAEQVGGVSQDRWPTSRRKGRAERLLATTSKSEVDSWLADAGQPSALVSIRHATDIILSSPETEGATMVVNNYRRKPLFGLAL